MDTRLSNLEATINMSAPLSVDDFKLGFGAHVAAENVTAFSVLYAWVAKIETRSNARSDKMEANFVEAKASMEKRSDAVVVDSKKLFDEANVRAETRSDEANVRAEGRSGARDDKMGNFLKEAHFIMQKRSDEANERAEARFDKANAKIEARSDEANARADAANVRAEERSDAANVEMKKHFNEANVEMKKHFNEALNKPKPISSIQILQIIISFLTLIQAWR
jgi:hypothetical protein